MKVLVVCTVDFCLNGITSVIMNYYRNIEHSDIEMGFVVQNQINDEFRDELTNNGSKIYVLKRNSGVLKYMYGLYRLLKKEKYDVIHIHGNSATMIVDVLPAFLARVSARIVHAHSTVCDHVRFHHVFAPVFRKLYTHCLACSQEAGKWLCGDTPFTVLKNGIDVEKYRYDKTLRDKYRAKLNMEDCNVIGHVGNFVEAKNHNFLIDAFYELCQFRNDCRLLLIGKGEGMRAIAEKVEKLGIKDKVVFLGETGEVCAYLQAMDMFVLPSIYEGMPVSLVEAQAAGLPCIVSSAVSRESDLSGKLQFLPIEDAKLWSKKMAERNETDRMMVCEMCQTKISDKGYDIKRNADVLKKFYIQTLVKK